MSPRFRKRLSRVPSRVALAVTLIVILVGAGIAMLFLRSGTSAVGADDSIEPQAARIEQVDGSVAIARVVENEEPDWAEATTNTPVTVGDRIYARGDSRASIALTGHNFVELKPDASLDVLALEDARTQLALRGGSAIFDIGELDESEAFEVATPDGAVNFVEPGLYQIGIDGDNTVISVLSGRAQVVGLEGSEYISEGQVFTLTGANATQALASTLEPELAGSIVDNHYRYRYPKIYDGRYADYDAYLEDPFYYDPYRTSVSCRYVPADVPGLYDLDYYGDWVDVDGYGHCWSPHVSADWAPFRHGRWDIDR
ncbi:MAG TPA: FecR family protein, partial [Blastocatellia bacterium]